MWGNKNEVLGNILQDIMNHRLNSHLWSTVPAKINNFFARKVLSP